MSANTGGPAFPQNTKIVAAAGQELHHGFMGGMTLRDYFAAQAMPLIMAAGRVIDTQTFQEDAETAYLMADAMLKAREG